MEQKLISVIMPVYKVPEKYLSSSIESILRQSYKNIEVILVDDGSPDNCGKICDSYSRFDARIKVIHKENGGVSSARNCGLETAQGEYILFIDSDDTLKTNAIEMLFQTAMKTNADITICSCNHVGKKYEKNKRNKKSNIIMKTVTQEEAIDYLTYNIEVFDGLESTVVWGRMYKKSILNGVFFNKKMNIGEDFIFNYLAICNSSIITYCNSKLYNYNYLETSVMNSKTYSPKYIQSFFELKKFVESQTCSEHWKKLVVRSINIAFTIYLKIPESKKEELKCIEEYIRLNRKKIEADKKINKKLKIAIYLSHIDFNLIRFVFNLKKILINR